MDAEGAVFGMHKGLLCRESLYFKAALEGHFKEATEGFVLDDEDPEVFQRFNTWLYTGKVLASDEEVSKVGRFGAITPSRPELLETSMTSSCFSISCFL